LDTNIAIDFNKTDTQTIKKSLPIDNQSNTLRLSLKKKNSLISLGNKLNTKFIKNNSLNLASSNLFTKQNLAFNLLALNFSKQDFKS